MISASVAAASPTALPAAKRAANRRVYRPRRKWPGACLYLCPKELARVPEDPGNAGLAGSGSDRRSAVEIVKRVCGTQWRALSTAAAFGTAPPGHLGIVKFPRTSSLIQRFSLEAYPADELAGYFFAPQRVAAAAGCERSFARLGMAAVSIGAARLPIGPLYRSRCSLPIGPSAAVESLQASACLMRAARDSSDACVGFASRRCFRGSALGGLSQRHL